MKKLVIITSILTSALMCSAFAENQAGHSKSMMKKHTAMKSGIIPPEDFVLFEEDVSINMQALPIAMMDEAISDFDNKNFGEASGDLKSAARLLRTFRGKNTLEKVGAKVASAAECLDQIAKDIRSNNVKSVDELKPRLAEAAYYMASAHRLQAMNEWNQRKMKRAGFDLNESSNDLAWSAKMSGKKVAVSTDKSIVASGDIASKLIAGTGWKNSEVDGAFEKLGTAVDDVKGKIFQPGFKAAESSESL